MLRPEKVLVVGQKVAHGGRAEREFWRQIIAYGCGLELRTIVKNVCLALEEITLESPWLL